MTDYVLQGLTKRRATLAGDIQKTQASMAQMLRDLETLDAAIRLIAPDLDIPAIAPKFTRPPPDWSQRGEMTKQVLDTLRRSSKPLTARDIAAHMIVERGLASTPKLLNLMTRRIAGCLRDKREAGLVRNPTKRTGLWLEWEVVR